MMFAVNKMLMYPLKRRKRLLISAICCVMIVYGGLELLYLHDNYSPLQLLSSVENEAGRLLKFIGQVQVQCNNSVATNNASTWILCQDPEYGVGSLVTDDKDAVIYSIGPSPDYSFENFVSRNLSTHLFVFSHLADKLKFLSKANPETTTLVKTTIVPNDPADFARNSFDTQTLNSMLQNFKHKEIVILKLDTFLETVNSYEVLRFLIDDFVLQNVKELHIVLKLDKVEEDYIYSWYRVLYALFHTAQFRLYHVATSDPLCLQDTVMESCKYYMSWIRQPPPQVFVLYPPAIDGSYEYEEERMLTFLENPKPKESHLVPVNLEFFASPKMTVKGFPPKLKTVVTDLSANVLKRNTHSCSIILIVNKNHQHLGHQPDTTSQTTNGCHQHLFVYSSMTSPSLRTPHVVLPLSSGLSEDWGKFGESSALATSVRRILTSSSTNILYIELEHAFDIISLFSSLEFPTFVDQLIIRSSIMTSSGKPQPVLLRKIYSELKRLEEFQFTLVASDKSSQQDLNYRPDQDTYTLNFVKTSLL